MAVLKRFCVLVLFLPFAAVQTSNAVPEDDYGIVFELLAHGEGSFYQRGVFNGQDGATISFTKFGQKKGSNGAIVILPGRTESSLKYLEVAYDLIQKGFSPLYVIDHRGQGFSDRALSDSHKGHVADFALYESDFNQFMKIVKRDPNVNLNKIFAVSHSMGGSVLIDYLSENPNTFKAAAFVAPMFRIYSDKTEGRILSETFLSCYILFSCDDYIPGGGPFRWQDRDFNKNNVTHSHTRFIMRDYLWRTWPQLQLGDPTVRWVREAVQANIAQRKQSHLSPIHLPIHMYQAEEDVVVEKTAQSEVCRKIGRNCSLYIVRGARHEILMETDRLRDAALSHIGEFFRFK